MGSPGLATQSFSIPHIPALQGLPFKRQVFEFPISVDGRLPVGFEVTSAHYVPGQTVDVVGWTKWKGFQGGSVETGSLLAALGLVLAEGGPSLRPQVSHTSRTRGVCLPLVGRRQACQEPACFPIRCN